MLKPGNLVPGPGANAMAVSMAGTVSRVGTNGIACHTSGTNGVRIPVNGMSFSSTGLVRGFHAVRSMVLGTGPTATGNRCIGGMDMAAAFKPNIGISTDSLWGGLSLDSCL